MPTREEIESFKDIINQWGDEPAVLAQLGEEIEDVRPPEQSLEESLGMDQFDGDELSVEDMLSRSGLEEDDLSAPPSGAEEEALGEFSGPDSLGGLDDFGGGLDSFDDSLGMDGLDDLDLDLGDGDAPAEAPPEDAPEPPPFEAEDPADGGDFDFDDGLPEGSGFPDLSEENFDASEEPVPEEPEAAPPEEAFDGLDELGLSELSDEEDPGIPDPADEEADLDALGDLGDLTDGAPEGADDFGGLDDLGLEEDPFGGGESLDIPDLSAEGETGGPDSPGEEEFGSPDMDGLDDLDDLDDLEDAEEPEEIQELDDGGDSDGIEEPRDVDISELDSPAEDLGFGEEIDLTSPDEEVPELGGLDDFSMEDEGEGGEMQFSLGDFGEEFNFQEGINFDDDMDASLDSLDTLDDTFFMDDQEEAEQEEEEGFEISEDDLVSLQDTLRILPLNLKLAIQDELAQADLTSERYQKLIDQLINGAPPRQIAAEFFNITGKKIELPRGYQRQSGRDFELKRTGFFYLLQEKGWPLIRLFTLILTAMGLVVFLSFQFLYRPLQAMVYYNQGLEKIEAFAFEEAEELFRKAYFGWTLGGLLNIEGWPQKGRFLEYADAYRTQREYIFAETMYKGLVGEYPDYLEGYLQYGKFLTDILGDYAESAAILSAGLDKDFYNYKLMLALGDNYMLWAETDPSKLEDARYQYATVLARYRKRDEVALRLLRYFIVRQDDQNVRMWGSIFQSKSSIKADSYFAAETLARLGGYFIDINSVSEAKDFLFQAETLDQTVPEVHYQLSRYFNKTYNVGQEKAALQKALYFLDRRPILSAGQIFMKIGIHRRRGEIHALEGSYDLAENEYIAGIRLLEDSQVRGLIGTKPEIGALYADMGNLHYEVLDDLKGALVYFIQAEKNQFSNGNISYKKGYVYYDQQDYDQAVLAFEKAQEQMEDKRATRYALANTMVKRQNLFGARNLYADLLRELMREENSLPYLVPEDIVEHRSLVNYFVLVYNNLGYVEYRLSQRSRDPERQSRALVHLSKAADYADRLIRDPDTAVRPEPEESPVFQNTMALLAPLPEKEVLLMESIPRAPDELMNPY